MRHPALVPLFLFPAALGLTADPSSPTPAEPPRALSPDTAAKVTAGLPKFSPTPPLPDDNIPPSPIGTPKIAEPIPDQPPDSIIRLPNYAVRDKPLPEFRDRELLTPSGRIDLALRRYPGLKFGPLALLNHDIARRMSDEDRHLERLRELADYGAFIQFADTLRPAASPEAPSTE